MRSNSFLIAVLKQVPILLIRTVLIVAFLYFATYCFGKILVVQYPTEVLESFVVIGLGISVYCSLHKLQPYKAHI